MDGGALVRCRGKCEDGLGWVEGIEIGLRGEGIEIGDRGKGGKGIGDWG